MNADASLQAVLGRLERLESILGSALRDPRDEVENNSM